MTHYLKILPQYYFHVKNETKLFEVRNNDRGFQMGDTVVLQEWDDSPINVNSSQPKGFTGSTDLEFKVGYVFQLDAQKVVFSLLKAEKSKSKAPKTAKK